MGNKEVYSHVIQTTMMSKKFVSCDKGQCTMGLTAEVLTGQLENTEYGWKKTEIQFDFFS